jgi:predicted DNA-binding protein
MVEYTNIRLRKETVEKLKKLGFKGETYDDIINRLIEEALKKHEGQ